MGCSTRKVECMNRNNGRDERYERKASERAACRRHWKSNGKYKESRGVCKERVEGTNLLTRRVAVALGKMSSKYAASFLLDDTWRF